MRKKIIIGTIIVVTTAALFGYQVYSLNKSIPVSMVEAADGVIRDSVYASGKLESMDVRTHFIPISGRVKNLAVHVGDPVTKGQTLLTMGIEDWEEQIRIEQNNREMIVTEQRRYRKQALENAKAELIAGKSADDLIDQNEQEMYRLRLEQIEMSIRSLEQKIAQRELKADLGGVITRIEVVEGQMVSQGLAAITVTQTNELKVTAYLNELDANKVETGMPVTVTGDAFGSEFRGELIYLSPVAELADVTSRDPSVELWVDVEGENEELRPGYNASIEIVVSEQSQLQLPLNAVQQKSDQSLVYMIEDGVAVEREVTLGMDDGEFVEILDGLRASDQVIGPVPDGLSAGKKVKPK